MSLLTDAQIEKLVEEKVKFLLTKTQQANYEAPANGVGLQALVKKKGTETLTEEQAREVVKNRKEENFEKVAPKFDPADNMPWRAYCTKFEDMAITYKVREIMAKEIMFANLRGEAARMATPDYSPKEASMKDKSFEEYKDALELLFEPEQEKSLLLVSYQRRVQLSNEHVTHYYTEKLNMFKRVFKEESTRNWESFYEEFIKGLLNTRIKMELRRFIPEPINKPEIFYGKLMRELGAIQKAYLAGELSDADLIGCEGRAVQMDTRPMKEGVRIKQEPINALTQKGEKSCFYCQDKGHFIAQCPRKMAGLPRVSVIGQAEEEEEDIAVVQGRTNWYQKKQSGNSNATPSGGQAQNQGGRQKFQRFRRRVNVIMGEDGHFYEDVEQGDGQGGVEDSIDTLDSEENEPVSNVGPGADDASGDTADHAYTYGESGYCPGAFLG